MDAEAGEESSDEQVLPVQIHLHSYSNKDDNGWYIMKQKWATTYCFLLAFLNDAQFPYADSFWM